MADELAANSDSEDGEEEEAESGTHVKLDSFTATFCTLLRRTGRPSATHLKEHIRKCRRVFCADGGSKELRALSLAADQFIRNIALLL